MSRVHTAHEDRKVGMMCVSPLMIVVLTSREEQQQVDIVISPVRGKLSYQCRL